MKTSFLSLKDYLFLFNFTFLDAVYLNIYFSLRKQKKNKFL